MNLIQFDNRRIEHLLNNAHFKIQAAKDHINIEREDFLPNFSSQSKFFEKS